MADANLSGPIAVICVGYLGNPAGLVRLGTYFSASGTRVYAHIDASVDASAYVTALRNHRNVVLLPDRRRIYWGGFSIIRTVIDAIAVARADADYARILFLTEDSVPLIEASVFSQLMRQPHEYMQADGNLGDDILRRYWGYYMFDCAEMNPRSWPETREVSAGLTGELHRLEELRRLGKFPLAQLYHGPTWWALTRAAIDHILREWNNRHLRLSFEFSMIPEEQYFHTVLRGADCRFEFKPFMYTDFSREPKPYVYRTMRELTQLRSMPLPFARKAALDSEEATRFVEGLCI